MSTACQCDLCEKLFTFEVGDVRLEYHVTTSVDDHGAPTQMCHEVDLCHKCSRKLLAFVRHDANFPQDDISSPSHSE